MTIETELDYMRAIAAGQLESPQQFGNMHLFAMRITGTGTAYRHKIDELVFRPPENYLSDEFLARCNGLPVIWEHPKKQVLDSEDFKDRIVGTISLPYIKGDEVWGIARIYDDDAIALLTNEQLSTSPSVVFSSESGNKTVELSDGSPILIEGNPVLLDHLAICEVGVWDKGNPPAGIKSDNLTEGAEMPEENKRADDGAVATSGEGEVVGMLKQISEKLAEHDKHIATLLGAKKDDDNQMPDEPMSIAPVAADDDESKKDDDKKADDDCNPKADDDDDSKKADDDEEKEVKDDKRADSAAIDKLVAARVAAAMPKELSDADRQLIAEAQARADSVASMFGERATAPLFGESPRAYRRRLAAQFQPKSAEWSKVKLAEIKDDAMFDIAESRIYADAQAASMSPGAFSGESLREIIKTDAAGRRIIEFIGNIGGFINQFKAPSRKVTGFNKQ